MLLEDEYNFLENLTSESFYEMRKIVIQAVLSSDFSCYFDLLTKLKTKLDNKFPTEAQEDVNLVISLTLKVINITVTIFR